MRFYVTKHKNIETIIIPFSPTKRKKKENKAVYTAAPVAGGWAGAVMSWAGAVITYAGAVMSWARAIMSLAGAIKAIRILKVKA